MSHNIGDLVSKMNQAVATCQNALVGRDEEVRVAWVAVLANENCFLIGDPGTAKSNLVTNIGRCFSDQRVFTRLLGKFVLPEEVFGPYDVQRLKQGFYNRKTLGYMPSATMAFLDEGFKAGESLLNSLLTLLNERQFDMGETPQGVPGGRVQTDLGSTFVASNEIPEGANMDALWDRGLVRLYVQTLNENEDYARAMLDRALDYPIRTADRASSSNNVQLSGGDLLTLAELDALQAAAQALPYTRAAKDAAMAFRAAIHQQFKGLLSDRTWMRLWNLPRAVALLEGSNDVQPDHLEILVHTLWREPVQRKGIAQVVYATCSPLSEEVRKELDKLREIATMTWPRTALESDETHIYSPAQRTASDLLNEMRLTVKRLATFAAETPKYGADLKIAEGILGSCEAELKACVKRTIGVSY